MEHNVLNFKDIKKSFGKNTVLKSVDLDFNAPK